VSNEDRDGLGRFESNLLVGTKNEQARAGVGVSDNEFTASAKVSSMRIQDIAAHNAKMSDASYAAAYAEAGREMKVRGRVTWLIFLLGGLLFWGWGATKVSSGPADVWVEMRSSAPKPVGDDFQRNNRERDIAQLAALFRPEAPLSEIHKGCASRWCTQADVVALDKFKAWAKPSDLPWEAQVCEFLVHERGSNIRSYLGIKPVWQLDRNKGYCVVKNWREFQKRSDALNTARHVVAIGLALLLVTVVRTRLLKAFDRMTKKA
jgi:hypothetical protein